MAPRLRSLAILIALVVGLGLGISNILSLTGTGGMQALLFFIAGSLGIGYVLGGRDPAIRSVMGLGTVQRNVSTVMVAAAHADGGGHTTLERREEIVCKNY